MVSLGCVQGGSPAECEGQTVRERGAGVCTLLLVGAVLQSVGDRQSWSMVQFSVPCYLVWFLWAVYRGDSPAECGGQTVRERGAGVCALLPGLVSLGCVQGGQSCRVWGTFLERGAGVCALLPDLVSLGCVQGDSLAECELGFGLPVCEHTLKSVRLIFLGWA